MISSSGENTDQQKQQIAFGAAKRIAKCMASIRCFGEVVMKGNLAYFCPSWRNSDKDRTRIKSMGGLAPACCQANNPFVLRIRVLPIEHKRRFNGGQQLWHLFSTGGSR